MALELKGLKNKALDARVNIDRLNRAYDAFNERAPAHASDVEGMANQVEEMNEDLGFAVRTLGNSAAQFEPKPEAKQTALPAQPSPVAQASEPQAAAVQASPEVEPAAATFHQG